VAQAANGKNLVYNAFIMAKNAPLLIDIGQGLSLMVGLPTIASWNTDERPKKAKRGTFGFNIQTQRLEYWSGADWYAAEMKEKI